MNKNNKHEKVIFLLILLMLFSTQFLLAGSINKDTMQANQILDSKQQSIITISALTAKRELIHLRKALLITLFSVPLFSQTHVLKTKFILDGSVVSKTISCVYLDYYNKEGKFIHDSCKLKKSKFQFTGFIIEPTAARFYSNKRTVH